MYTHVHLRCRKIFAYTENYGVVLHPKNYITIKGITHCQRVEWGFCIYLEKILNKLLVTNFMHNTI